MAVDYNKGVRPNVYELMQGGGGGSYELPPATDETLGGVIIGRGIDVEPNGTISVTAPAPADTYTKAEIDAQQADQNSRIAANATSIANAETDISNIEQDISEITQNYPPRITALETSQAAQDTAITSLQAHEQQQDTAISVNASAILANTRAIEDIAQDIQDIAADYAPRISALETSQAAQDTIISGIQTDIGNINLHQSEQDTNIGNNASAILALETDLETLSTTVADDATLGLVKTDSSKFISTDENGKLQIGGRLGQFPETTGLFAPDDREPRRVGNYDLLITDVKGAQMTNNRAFAVVSGYNITLKTAAAAGATEYHVANTYANRIKCKICEYGFAAKDEDASRAEQVIPVVSVTINGEPYAPDSSPDDSTQDIIITTEETLNPDEAITSIRAVGTMGSYSTAYIGNGIASIGGGRCLLLGSGITKDGAGNECCVVAQDTYVSSNGSAVFGRWHIVNKNRAFIAGQGHDTTNARADGASAIGVYSLLNPIHVFAVGLGSSQVGKRNVFEVTAEHGGTARANFMDAKNAKFEFASEEDIIPAIETRNWTIGNGGSIQDFDGTPGFSTTDVKGTAVNITVGTGFAMPVTPGESIDWSITVRKKTGNETGKFQVNLMSCSAIGTGTSSKLVKDGTAASYSTEWTTYSGTFVVPDGMEFMLPRISRTNTGAGSDGGYDIKDFKLIRAVDSGIILHSPNGGKYKVTVDNNGTLSTVAV